MKNASTLPRLFVENDFEAESSFLLSEEHAHYLTHVLRLAAGDSLRLFDGKHGEWQATIVEAKKKKILVHLETCLFEQRPAPDVHLYCAPIKKSYFDFMIMKATELGVSAIHPVLTARTQVREVNVERLRSIAIEAAEQSERHTVPILVPAEPLEKIIRTWDESLTPLVCAEFGAATPIAQALSKCSTKTEAGFFIGPEGGFEAEEINQLSTLKNVQMLRLGPRILRADTAAIAALSCWQALCGDWQSHPPSRETQI